MRAVSEDADAAALMGIDVDKVVVFTFALGGAMAGVAGVCYAFVFKQVYFYMGFTPGIKAFGAAVLGGIGSVPGAMLGGLFLGDRRIRRPGPLPRRHRHSRALSAARPDRLHPPDHGADLPALRHPGRAHGQETRMSAATVDLADRASHRERSPFRRALGVGLVLGLVAVYGATVGILPLMDARWVIVDVVSLGDAALIAIGLSAGTAVAARTTSSEFWRLAPPSLLAGGVAGALVALLTSGDASPSASPDLHRALA